MPVIFRVEAWKALAAGAGLFTRICVDRAVRGLFLHADGGLSPVAAGRLVIGVLTVARPNSKRGNLLDLVGGAFAKFPNAALARYALPEAARALAGSDPDRVKALLRAGERFPQTRRLSLAVTSAYLGDAEGVEFFTTGLKGPDADAVKRRFAAQRRVARKLGVSADFRTVHKAARETGKSKRPQNSQEAMVRAASGDALPVIGLLDGCDPAAFPGFPVASEGAQEQKSFETVPVDRDFPLALAAVDGPVWLPVAGPFGRQAYPDHLYAAARRQEPVDFPFPGNVRPLFTAIHIAAPEILDGECLKYLRRFAPIGCRDLFTARLLRGAGVKAFVGSDGVAPGGAQKVIVQPVLDAIREGKTEAKIYALWRKLAAPAMARTDAMIAEQNAKHPLPKVRLERFGLDKIPVRSFGDASSEAGAKPVHVLFGFDDNWADIFPGTFEGIWKNRKGSRPLVVHIFGMGLSAAMFEQWAVQFARSGAPARACPGVRFAWYDISGIEYPEILNLAGHISAATLNRLLAPALLPEVEKVVYLDTDILVRTDISDLFDTDLGDAPFAARRDPHGFKALMAQEMHRLHRFGTEERIPAIHNAFFDPSFMGGAVIFDSANVGVMVMNLARMRRDRAVEKMFSLVQTNRFCDGRALNLYARGRWKPLARKWNFIPHLEAMENPAIVHFLEGAKPWTPRRSPAHWVRQVMDWAHGDGRAGFRAFRQEWRENMERAQKRVSRNASEKGLTPEAAR